jgi:TonB-linked SusC/RagA family outer membrane protein
MKNFKKMRKVMQGKRGILSQFLIALLGIQLIFALNVYGQQMITVSGTVTDAQGLPLPGATVLEEGTTNGTVTNNDGAYTINVPGNATLVISFVGMSTQRVPVNSRTQVNIRMVEETIGLEEVIAIGYSTQSRAKVTSAVSQVKEEELKNIPSVSPAQALQGKMAGVSVPVMSGQPGENPNIVIRGGTTYSPYPTTETGGGRNASDPLYIVDGVFRDIGDINPDDIESIQVMKDAASTAIYGARGANGVIVVTTKSGKASPKANITFRYQHGIETQARKFDYLNAREYLETFRPAKLRGIDNFDPEVALVSMGSTGVPTFNNPGEYGKFKFTTAYIDNLIEVEGQSYVDNLLANGWETMADPVDPSKTIIFKDANYQDVVWNTAHTNNYNFGVNGGTEAVTYYVSLGYVDQGGVFLGTNYERFSGLANVDLKVNDKISLSVNSSYLWNNNKYSESVQNDITRGTRIPDLIRLYNDDGTPNLGESNNPRNRLHQLYYQDYNRNSTQFIFRVAGEYKIIPGLSYRPSASINTDVYTRMDFEKFYPEQGNPRNKYQRIDERKQIMTDHILQYNKSIDDIHNFMVLGGFNFTQNKFFNVIGTSKRSASDYISTITGDPISETLPGGTVSPNKDASSSFSMSRSASYFGQFNYDYLAKYLFAASIRRDGFSNFAPENRWALFPSFSAGWVMSKEDFWNSDWMSNLKVRSSWGETGLSNLSIGDTYGIYGSTVYATSSGIYRSNIPNPNLVWETTTAFDAGVDLGFFNNRVNAAIDYYNKLTKNRLSTLPLPAETGFSSIAYNVGSLRNSGFEFELDAFVINNNNFSWNTSFTFAYNKQVIVELPDNERDKNRIGGGIVYDPKTGQDIEVGGFAEGERPFGLWAWKSNGIFATDEEAAASPIKDLMAVGALRDQPRHGGDVDWADLNGDNIIDGKDLVFMGYRTPDKIGGFQNTFNFKGFTLRINMDYALGHIINNGELARGLGQGRSYNEGAPREAIGNEIWKEQGDAGKKYPRISFGDWDVGRRNHLRFLHSLTGYSNMGLSSSYGVDNSIYYSKGDFLAFREISLAYNVPKSVCENLKVSNIVLNSGIYNIGYITAYDGYNPEVYTGYDGGAYPRPRQFTFGATITF